MSPLPRRKRAWLLSSLLLLAAATGGHAQDGEAGSPPDAFPGSDDPAFERLFGEALRRKPPAPPPIDSAAMLAGNVSELRLFLTEEAGIVRGEIVAAGPSTLATFSVEMEEGTVVFRDDGVEPDRVGGDGGFTARFQLDTTAEFEALRADLRETIEVLRKPSQDILIRRGPRDIVTAADAIGDAERKMPEALNMARQEAERAARLLEF